MSDPFNPDISLILAVEQTTQVSLEEDHFAQKKAFAVCTLQGWGLSLGQLFWSPQNVITLNSLLQLIAWRQKESTQRARVKQDLVQMQFQKQKYRSLLEQNKRALDEKNKLLGRSQNQLHQIKNVSKQQEQTLKREREEEKKVVLAYKNRSQQALIQIKKKQQQLNRIKEQLKKSVTEKNVPVKNSFQIIQSIELANSKHNENVNVQTQLQNLRKEHSILRDKLFEIRQQIVQFAQGIERELYNIDEQTLKRKYKSMFVVNHNFLFRKECIVKELKEFFRDLKKNVAMCSTISIKSSQKKEMEEVRKSEKVFEVSPRAINLPKNTKSMVKIKPTTSKIVSSKLELDDNELSSSKISFNDKELSMCSQGESSIISFIDPTADKKHVYDLMGDILFPRS